MVFAEISSQNVTPPLQQKNTAPSVNGADKKSVAQVKAKYGYPWWASNEAIEIFLGQANEPVQIVPLQKFLASVKAAMGREVFEQELSEPQALLDELQELVGVATIGKLKAKISASRKQPAA